ncbi:MAG: hypothetical protein GY696_02875, partial [Gammaproteobacteria bacterium]|nr:hypothetical protein [Gammaproteobacteria bacterium]
MVLDRTLGDGGLPPTTEGLVQSHQNVGFDDDPPVTQATGGAAWTTGGTPAGPHAVGFRGSYPPPPPGLLRPPPPPPSSVLLNPMGRAGSQNDRRKTFTRTIHPSAGSIPLVRLGSHFPDGSNGEPAMVQTTTSEAVASASTEPSGAFGEERPQAISSDRDPRDFLDYSLDDLGAEIRRMQEIFCERNGTKPKRKTASAEEPKKLAMGGLPKPSVGGEVTKAGLSTECGIVASASRPISSDFVQATAAAGFNHISDNRLNATYYEGQNYARDGIGHLGQRLLPWYNPPQVPQDQHPFLSQTTPAFQEPQMHSTLAGGFRHAHGAGPGSAQVPSDELIRSRFIPPFVGGGGRSAAFGAFKMEKPLLTFDGTRGPEDFDRFHRTFEFYIHSRGAERFGLQLVETWLEGTPLLVYQQFLRDHPFGSFAELKEVLRANFGKPLDARRAVHKLHSVQWREGQSLVQLATEIRDLHYRAHPTLAVEFRESYAGDTFIRCLPEKWQMRLRDRGGATLTEYLLSAQELESRDSHKTEIHLPFGSSSNLRGNSHKVEGEKGLSEQGTPRDGAVKPPKKAFRCYFCKKPGHVKSDCRKYATWKKKREEKGEGSSQGQSAPGRSTRIEEEPPVGGPQSGKAESLKSEIVDYCADGGVHMVSSFSSPQIKCPLDIEGVRVHAVVDSGSDINIISAKCFKSFATAGTKAQFSERFRPVDRRFFSYGREEIGFLKVWLPLWVEFEGLKAYVPVVVDEDPACDSDCILGSLGMKMLGFRILTPSGDVDLLSYNQAGSRVRELRQEFPEFWPKEEGSDEAEGECSRVFRVT